MLQEIGPLETALRVLTALIEGETPNPADVEELLRHAPQSTAGNPLDLIACEVIHQALRQRRELGSSSGGA
jgi:hypothetical protein